MANFITCWLQAPGDLPVDDGPPGGGGDGGPDGGDNGDDECTGKVTYYCCDPVGMRLDSKDVQNCTKSVTHDKATVTNNCETEVPECWKGCCQNYDEGNECEQACHPQPTVCTGFLCLGPPQCTPNQFIATDQQLWDGQECGKGPQLGCDDIWGMFGECKGKFESNQRCMFDDDPVNGGPGDCLGAQFCPSFICTEVGCEPGNGLERGVCTGSMVSFTDCPNFWIDNQNPHSGCYTGANQTCMVQGVTHHTKQDECEKADECIAVLKCPAWECEPGSPECDKTPKTRTSSLGDCCDEVLLDNKNGNFCEEGSGGCMGEGNYIKGSRPNTWNSETECEVACIECGDGWLCKDPEKHDDKYFYGDCEQDPICALIWNPDDKICEVPRFGADNCFRLKWQCLESGCECKGFYGCELALNPMHDDPQCRLCEPSGMEVGKHGMGECFYDDIEQVFFGGKTNPFTMTCQAFYENFKKTPHYFEIPDEFSKPITKINCEQICQVDQFQEDDEELDSYGLEVGSKAYERIYGTADYNPIYEKYISNVRIQNGTTFLGVPRGDLRDDLFKNRVHVGIRATSDIINKKIRFSDNPFSDLNSKNLEKSINDDIILKLNLARQATGQPLKRIFLNSIRGLIISNRLDSFNVQELKYLLNTIIRVQDTPEYKDTRDYTPLLNLDTISNEAAAIELAMKHVWPLDPANYDEVRVAERMRTWKTLAPDLQKGLPITTSTGATTIFYYSISDTIVLDGSGILTMSNGDLQQITLSDGTIAEIPVQSLIKRAGILSLEVLQKLMYLLGDRYDFNIKVTTDPTLRVDEKYGLSNKRKNLYFLSLQPDTITDLERNNPFVARTSATYKYETDVATRNSIVNTAGSGAAFPCLQVYLDINDPILSYIQNNGTVEVTFKDFVLDLFDEGDTVNAFIPVIARRAPQVIAIYTSDMTSKVVTHTISKSTSYGVREIKVVMNPNPDKIDNWGPVFIKEVLAYPGRGINPTVENTQAVQYSIATKDLSEQTLYSSGEQPAKRIAWGERQVYKLAKELKDNYQLPANNTINWYEIYERIPIPQMKYLHRECANFKKFKSLLSMGIPSSNKTVNAYYPKIKEYRSRNWLGVTRLGLEDSEKVMLVVKPDHTPIPLEPLD